MRRVISIKGSAIRVAASGVLAVAVGCASGNGSDARPEASVETTTSPTAGHPFAGESAWIAYQTDRGGEGTWLIHPDGTDDHQIARDFEGSLILPDWSPDGQRLVLSSRETGGAEPLYVYDLETEEFTQLFDCKELCLGDDEPAYSPDGERVAFIRALGPIKNDLPSDCGLWIGEIASGKIEQITSNKACDREYLPRWSRGGDRLAYHRLRTGGDGSPQTAVFVIDSDRSDEVQLTDWDVVGGAPDWSPDGESIVFGTHPLNEFGCCEISDLFLLSSEGGDPEPLTEYNSETQRATQPRYAPDGKRLVFTLETGSSRELWILPLDSGEPIAVAEGGIYTHGTWQPT
jgi:Tol biopolymer transport system component